MANLSCKLSRVESTKTKVSWACPRGFLDWIIWDEKIQLKSRPHLVGSQHETMNKWSFLIASLHSLPRFTLSPSFTGIRMYFFRNLTQNKDQLRDWRDGFVVKSTAAATTWWLTTICDEIYCPILACRHTCSQNTIYIINKSKRKKERKKTTIQVIIEGLFKY